MANYINTVVRTTGTDLGDYGSAVSLADSHVRAVYSQEIYFQSLPIMRFLSFAKYKEELGTQPGLTIQMLTYKNLRKGGTLTEGTPIQTQAMSASYKQITVAEQGNATAVTELALRTSFTDVMADATTLLAQDMALTLDCQLRDVALTGGTGTSVIYGRADKNAAKISDIANVTADTVMSVATIKDAVEILATNNCPKFGGQYYVCIVHPHVSRVLRDDPAWINARDYADPSAFLNGEIGMIDDVKFIESTLMCNGAAFAGDDDNPADPAYKAALADKGVEGAFDVYESVIFGQDYYGYAVGLPVELRDNGVEDFGRVHSLAWYAIWGSAVLHAERGVVIRTV
jgi:N4-gp56 family major capsid protein